MLVASCSIQEENFEIPQQDDVIFYASFEQPSEETKVYVNEDLYLRWTADDRVSIFNKLTYNQQYKFTGNTGANAGGFKKVDSDEFVTGNTISHVVSVYPYQEATEISENEVLTLTLPAEQHYAENTFGLGANTMVAVSEDNVLQYKNVGGYLRISLYGEGVSVSSITLKGNNGEKLAGKATLTMPVDGAPTAALADDAMDEITLVCDTPVAIGATPEESVDFWFVVPPITFVKGFQITVFSDDGVFKKSTEKSLTIERNKLFKMSPIEAEFKMATNVIYYTSLDGNIVTPKQLDAFGAAIISNEYEDGKGTITFDGTVTTIGDSAFSGCSNLLSIRIPGSVTSIGHAAFSWCDGLASFIIPDSVTSIGSGAFSLCVELTSIEIPESVTSIDPNPFSHCYGLASIVVRSGNPVYDSRDNCNAIVETQSNTLVSGCKNTVIPNSVTIIGDDAFVGADFMTIDIPNSVTSIGMQSFSYSGLTSIVLPESIQTIGALAFSFCSSLKSMTVLATTPPALEDDFYTDGIVNDFPIYVPAASVEAYRSAAFWSNYADRIRPLTPLPEAIDLGLPSGLKWASFNLGATKPEEYGDYYAWGEIEPYYISLDPLTWKEGKEAGYVWSSYRWCMGSENTLTKYCYNSEYGYNGYTDSKIVLDPEDDAAYLNLCGSWRMPTDAEWTELRENCTWTWTTQNGVSGRLVTASNGNSIFLPAAGRRYDTDLDNAGSVGYYWSSSLYTGYPSHARYVYFDSGSVDRYNSIRFLGLSFRPVYAE